MSDATSLPHDALLVVKVQTDLFAGENAVYNGPAVLERIAQVIAQARSAAIPVIFIQDDDVAPVSSPGWELHPGLEVRSTDARIQKAMRMHSIKPRCSRS